MDAREHEGAGPQDCGFLSLAETLSFFIALVRDERVLYVNPAACAVLGRSQEALLGRPLLELVHPDDRERAVPGHESAGPAQRRVTQRFVRADGRALWLDCSIDAIELGDGAAWLVAGHDVTERKQLEEDLRRSQANLAEAQRIARVASWEWDLATDRVTWSDEFYRICGLDPAQVEASYERYFAMIHPDDRRAARRTVDGALGATLEPSPFQTEQRLIRPDGDVRTLWTSGRVDVDGQGRAVRMYGVIQDVTERRRAEQALRESEERYRALVEHAPEAILVYDADLDRYVDANARAERLFGYPRERLLTMSPLDFCPTACRDYDPSAATRCGIDSVLGGGTAVFESSQIDASGREFPCQIRYAKLPATGRNLVRVTITDISEQKELQQRIQHAEQMAAIGMLAAGVAHEIGNPLHALSMAAQSLERRASDDYAKRKLALIREHIERIARIVRQMGDQARRPSRIAAAVDANQVVRRALEVIRHDKRADGAEVRFELCEPLPPVHAVEDELTQVCINLALNAFDAMASLPQGQPRRLTIRSEATDSLIKVSFHDTGPGVPRELRARLFQPFFTTKGVGKGTGLGLSLSYRILQAHHGTLRLDERAGPGAAFVFELPLAKAS